jgi:hypothetical protein
MVKASLRRCEKITILFPQSGTKAQRKANSNFFNVFANLCGFAPLREPVWLFNRFLHSFCVIHRRIGEKNSGKWQVAREETQHRK